MKLMNQEPTETEELLFYYYGLYVVESSEETVKYAPVHTENRSKTFPNAIEIDEVMIEWDNSVTFDKTSETVMLNSFCDIDEVNLILKRMEELGFQKILTNIREQKGEKDENFRRIES